MCGATPQQTEMYDAQKSFYDMLTKNYGEAFAAHKEILNALTESFMPILKAGPDQRGFSAGERTALDTQVKESTARGYHNAQETLNERLAARGGSDFIPSGGEAQMDAALLGMAGSEEAALNQKTEMADWETGRRMYLTAAQVLGGAAAQWNPTGFANAATNAGNSAADTANQIAAADNSIWNAVIGGISGIAGSAVQGWAQGAATSPSGGGGGDSFSV